ncbi:MBL fold metallo-hydrolase [Calidifontibacter terrae]
MSNNAYVVRDAATGEALLIDAATEWPALQRALDDADVSEVVGILTTHRHHDHVGALPDAVSATGAATYAGEADADALPVPVDHRLNDGDTLRIGDLVCTATHIRGHTPGSIALSFVDAAGATHLFTGDTLFPGGVGATNHYDYQSFSQLIDDVEERLFGRFDDATWAYPGHGDDTTLGAERPSLTDWRKRGW